MTLHLHKEKMLEILSVLLSLLNYQISYSFYGQIFQLTYDIGVYLEPLKAYILKIAQPNDYLLVQGDFGGTYNMVSFSKIHDFVSVYATTNRNVIEKKEGNTIVKKSIFEHVKFREYI